MQHSHVFAIFFIHAVALAMTIAPTAALAQPFEVIPGDREMQKELQSPPFGEVITRDEEKRKELRAAHRLPGQHTLAFDVSNAMPRSIAKTYGAAPFFGAFFGRGVKCIGHDEVPSLSEFPGPLFGQVGWGQTMWGDSRCMAFVLELSVIFDTHMLEDVPEKTIDRAVLTYGEAAGPICPMVLGGPMGCWLSGTGNPEHKPNGCVVVRIPTVNWPETAPPPGPVPYSRGRPTVTRISAQEWDVTEPIRWRYQPGAAPLGAARGYGFVISGGPSLDQLDATDSTVCVSALSDIKLNVTYTVPDDEPFRAPR